jgi:hypothetical protein
MQLFLAIGHQFIKNEICYFKYSPLGDYLKEFLHDFEPKIRNFELNVPTPFKVGDVVEAKITAIDFDKKRVSLSMRALLPEDEQAPAKSEEAAE